MRIKNEVKFFINFREIKILQIIIVKKCGVY